MSETKNTKDYGRFSFFEENRQVTRNFVNRLKHSFQERDIGERYPIIVDSSYRIYDGQNRFTARRELGLPIFYQVDDTLTIADIGRISANVKKWVPGDWLKYHLVRNENSMYKVYAGFRRRWNLNHTVALTMLNHGEYTKGMFEDFKAGKLVIRDINLGNEYAKIATEIRDQMHFSLSKSWYVAIVHIANMDQYNHTRMMKKLGKYTSRMRPCTKWQDCVRELEGVYNWRTSAYVRFI
jgi:hypothetical protein